MRIISLDLLLGTPRLQRRIDAEHALLQRDLAVVQDNTQLLRAGVARKVTSLPALAASVATGFIVTKLASVIPRRPPREKSDRDKDSMSGPLAASTSLAWQFLMPLLVGWIQARFAPPAPTKEPEEFPEEQ